MEDITLRRRLHGVSSPDPESCIFRVRRTVYKEHRNAYAPFKISIGPLHHKKSSLQAMENHKNSYLHSFLKRNPDMTQEDYLKAIVGLEAKIRACYEEDISLNREELLEIMVVDGCFIIELLIRNFKISGASISSKDPIFSDAKMLSHIRLDLILLENQLPFFVLQCLFNITTAFNKTVSLVELALHFFSNIVPSLPGNKKPNGTSSLEVKHLLDLIRLRYAPLTPTAPQLDGDGPRVLKWGAKALQDVASVKFKKGKSRMLLDIKFHLNAIMEIPALKIQSETACLLRNFIAFEHCCGGVDTYMSDYICFMASLVKSASDVKLLQENGILETGRYDNNKVHRFFEGLAGDVIIHQSNFSGLCNKVEMHCSSAWRLWLASYSRDLGDSFSAFVALLVLVVVVLVLVYVEST